MTDNTKTTIGIIGGGQLGKMLIESGNPMSLNHVFLDPNKDCPAATVSEKGLVGSLKDSAAINRLAEISDVLTYEIESVDVATLKTLQASGKMVFPLPEVLEVIQDKGNQKDFYTKHGISTLPYVLADDNLKQQVEAWEDDRFVLKHRKGGYDGKGVQLLSKDQFLKLYAANDDSLQSEAGYVIEKLLSKPVELSVIVVVDRSGNIEAYQPCEMVFDQRSNLMDYLISPINHSNQIIEQSINLAKDVVAKFNSPGIFAVEQFLIGSTLYVNEIAPRPHNSGHHTIESCYTSQYDQLNRILMNYPIGSVGQHKPALTCNIVGPQGFAGDYTVNGMQETLELEGVYVHMYGKTTSKADRKLGHFTVVADTTESCISKMELVKKLLQIKST